MSSIGIFNRLGFPASLADKTITFSDSTLATLNNLPPILTTWQMQDIANSNTTGYFTNPVGNYASNIVSTMASIKTAANSCNLFTVEAAANSSAYTANVPSHFLAHTDRISNVSPPDPNDPSLPQYNTCIGLGKALTFIIYQSDGISNNAVMMGNFGSLYTTNTVSSYAANLYGDLILIQSNISGGNSTLSPSQVSNIISHINTTNTFLYTSYSQDESYFANCRTIVNDYNSVKGLSHMGDTEKYLANTLIGTTKLKQRIY